jgi:hypothetical protein
MAAQGPAMAVSNSPPARGDPNLIKVCRVLLKVHTVRTGEGDISKETTRHMNCWVAMISAKYLDGGLTVPLISKS